MEWIFGACFLAMFVVGGVCVLSFQDFVACLRRDHPHVYDRMHAAFHPSRRILGAKLPASPFSIIANHRSCVRMLPSRCRARTLLWIFEVSTVIVVLLFIVAMVILLTRENW